ncbi:unnamed protein product [Rotaria sp. Silwood1]|nr:unnamed protein product [Rotaria sp. Silwood1]CAF1627225.1 unnamed protein product [Rotaria sp. Silwood1]CAF3734842.1 unnamed protein product [Rotaria sp. Silwood1]CAF3778215.1 unnamed protein product [Rotaria sp. Silwood1]CAF3813643.1 unnamed protein product [Rotaria sp. Silwood1]
MKKKQVSFSNQLELATIEPNAQVPNLSVTQDLPMKKIYNPLDLSTSSDPTLLLPNYLTISDSKFKEMLLTSTSNNMNTEALSELLNQKEILVFIRQLTHLVNKLNYTQLQHEQWSYYYNLGMTEGIWTGRVSKKMAEANSMCYSYGRSKVLIKQRLAKYKQQCPQIQETINQHMKQIPPNIDMTLVTNMINSLIQKDQHQLRLELGRRKTMLRLDAQAHQLVDHFYTLKPRQTEVSMQTVHRYLQYT